MADGTAQLPAQAHLEGGGETGRMMRGADWGRTPLGPATDWPQPLKTLTSVMLSAGQPMFMVWGPEQTLLYNDAYAQILGDKHPSAMGGAFTAVWSEIRDDLEPIVAEAYAGRPVNMDRISLLMERRGRPEEAFFSFSYTPVRDENGDVGGFFCACAEITDQVAAERRLAAEAERHRRMYQQAPGFICITEGPDHVFSFVNAACIRLFGDRDLIGRTARDAFPDLEGQGVFEQLDRIYSTGERFVGQAVAVRLSPAPGAEPQDRVLDFVFEPMTDEAGRVTGIFCEGFDVTEAVAAREALRRSEEFSRRLLASSSDCIKVLDLDGRLESMSEGGRRALMIEDGSALVGRDWADMFEPDGRAAARQAIASALAGRTARFEASMRTALGELRNWDSVLTPVADADGRPEKILALSRDITVRKETEESLREAENRFRTMADSAPMAIWVTDPTGWCTYLNARWYEFTGQAPGAGEGYGWLDAVHPEDRPAAEQAFVSANAEQRDYQVDFRLRTADGAYRWVIDAAAARFGPDGEFTGYVGSLLDIDERREAEARLRYSEEQLRLATEAAEIALWDVDVATDTLFWPSRLKAMFGMGPETHVTLADFEAGLHPEDRPAVMAAFDAARDPAVRALYDQEYRTIGRNDGVVRWVAAKGRGLFEGDVLTRVIGTAIDVTARKADEARLRELNETLEHEVERQTAERNRVWSMSRDLLAVMGFDGYLKAINPAWQTTLGFSQADLLTRPFGQQVHPDDHPSIIGVMERLNRGETVERFEDRLLDAQGQWRWISWTLVPGEDVFYAVGRDVTAEKAAASELLQAQEALRQSQKMEAMGQLTGGVAHDFNNLLTPIVGGLDMLQRRGLGGPREQRLIDAALQSADRAKILVQRLLAFARRQPLQAGAVDVAKLVTGMADLVASTSGPKVKVVLDVAGDLPPAMADANQVEMALLNLGVNARDAMPDGGVLRISADQEDVAPGHRSGLAPGRYVRLSVADTGVGMDEAVLARAIEPFFSTKGVGRGTGLGLSMVHGLASQLGGALTIDSRPGVGTNVELWLPVTAESAPGDGPVADGAGFQPSRATVLLVEDEELVRMSTADMLGDLGYTVVEADCAEAALKLVEAGLRPDLVITDHLMPGMTGTELAHRLRAENPTLPVLLVSGYAEREGVTPDLPRLTKPFRNAELAAALAAMQAAAPDGPEA